MDNSLKNLTGKNVSPNLNSDLLTWEKMATIGVLLFRHSIPADKGEPDQKFKSLSKQGVDRLKRVAKEHLINYRVKCAISAPAPVCLDSMSCLLAYADIAFIPEFRIVDSILDPGNKFDQWFKMIQAAQITAEDKTPNTSMEVEELEEKTKIDPKLLLQLNTDLVMEAGKRLQEFITVIAKNLRNHSVAVLVSQRGIIESLMLYLAQKSEAKGKLIIDRQIEWGEGLLFTFDNSKIDISNSLVTLLPIVPEKTPEIQDLDYALKRFSRRKRY